VTAANTRLPLAAQDHVLLEDEMRMNHWISANRRYLKAWGSYLVFGLLLRLLWGPIIRVVVKLIPSGVASLSMFGTTLLWVTTAVMWAVSFFIFRFIIRTMIEAPEKEREQNRQVEHISDSADAV